MGESTHIRENTLVKLGIAFLMKTNSKFIL